MNLNINPEYYINYIINSIDFQTAGFTLVIFISYLIYGKNTNIFRSFEERTYSLFSLQSILRLCRYSLGYYLIALFISELSIVKGIDAVFNLKMFVDFRKWYLIIGYYLIILLIYYIISHISIRNNLRKRNFAKISYLNGLFSYCIPGIIGMIFVTLFWDVAYYLVNTTNNWFAGNQMSLYDWLVTTVIQEEDFKRGFYMALLISIICSFIFLNSVGNMRSSKMPYVKNIFLTVLLFCGLICGIYSILNSIYNIQSYGSISKWYKIDNIIGIFSIRLTAILLLKEILVFIYTKVLSLGLINIIRSALSPTRQAEIRHGALSDNDYSTSFLIQLGFYNLNVVLSEVSFIFQEENIFRSILNFLILNIVSAYLIIHEYSKAHKSILNWHHNRIIIYNVMLLVGAILTLYKLNNILFWIIYIAISLILLRMYDRAYYKINITRN